MRSILIANICVLCLIFEIKAQDVRSENLVHKTDTVSAPFIFNAPIDSSRKKRLFEFGNEKGGAVCINGLEKLEIALNNRKSLTAVSQLHFYGPSQTEGRVFTISEQEKEEKSKVHFFETTFDLTWKEFPLHIGYTMGIDQVNKNPNTTYSGLSATVYWSDIKYVHNAFHILRTSVSLLGLNEHLVNNGGLDSTVSRNKKIEYSVFYQMQPIHINEYTTIYSEALLRKRGKESFSELEFGIRDEKIMENLIGLGLKVSFEDFNFYSITGVIRFNISNPNPKHQ